MGLHKVRGLALKFLRGSLLLSLALRKEEDEGKPSEPKAAASRRTPKVACSSRHRTRFLHFFISSFRSAGACPRFSLRELAPEFCVVEKERGQALETQSGSKLPHSQSGGLPPRKEGSTVAWLRVMAPVSIASVPMNHGHS